MTTDARYVIGLDIGDGESCLVWASLDRSGPRQIYTRPRSGERSIVTAMAQPPSGGDRRTLIGDEAVTSSDATHFSVNFKTAPDALTVEPPGAVSFAQTLLTEFREHHPDVIRDAVVFVGHPAGWPPESVAAYGRHLELLDLPVRLVPESQSALLYVRDQCTDGKRLERVLVVDIGSSTTDFTIVENLAPTNLPVGTALGCRQIDEQLADRVRTEFRGDTEFMEALSGEGGQDFLLLACRWAKEAQFSGKPQRLLDLRQSCDKRFRPIVVKASTWLEIFDIPEMVATGGWGGDFRAVLTDVADMLGGRLPRLVIMTGGGSRMPLTDRLCHEVFPTAAVERDEDPAFTVARGLVSYGQQWVKVTCFRSDMTELAKAPQTKEMVRTEAEFALGTMKEKITTQVLEAHRTAASMAKHIRLGVSEATVALNDSLNWSLSKRVTKICKRYDIPYDHEPLNFTPPDLFEDQLTVILKHANELERFVKGNALTGLGQPVQSLLSGVKGFRLAASIASAVGFLAGSLRFRADLAARPAIQRMLRLGEYTPEQLDQLTIEVMETIAEQTNDLTHELERWLA